MALSPGVSLRGTSNGADADELFVKGPRFAAGATVALYRTGVRGEPRQLLKTKTSNRFGNVRFRVADLNGRDVTQYRAFVRAQEDVHPRIATNRREVR